LVNFLVFQIKEPSISFSIPGDGGHLGDVIFFPASVAGRSVRSFSRPFVRCATERKVAFRGKFLNKKNQNWQKPEKIQIWVRIRENVSAPLRGSAHAVI
jgi:hypothetical protein